jgi:hypothetical protein
MLPRSKHTQTVLDFPLRFRESDYDYGDRASGERHGVVLTKSHVVNLILDLAGYTIDRDLAAQRLLDPACGHGAFLVPAARRLVRSARQHGHNLRTLGPAIAAYDVEASHVGRARTATVEALQELGISDIEAKRLAVTWVAHGDFLLSAQPNRYEAVVGNPPYIRIEQLSPKLQEEYRRRYASLYDRADLYVAFIEHGLGLLAPRGVLSFICADRWILNKYGAPLRAMVTKKFRVKCYIDLHDASPFESDVIAYPSIFAISTGKTDRVHVATLATASPEECASVLGAMKGASAPSASVTVSTYDSWFDGEDPWVLSSPAHLGALRALEARFAPIEHGGRTRVGIGVATGNDKVYIVGEDADIEQDRLVPLVMRDDIEDGHIRDSRRFVINTFQEDGHVVDLRDYPRLAHYLEAHAAEVKGRHVAKKNTASWFRTIDRVYPDLVHVKKLLIPDIAGSNEVVYDKGRFHPHHNLYFVTSTEWDMEALGGLLSSKVALFFVWSYAVKMRGGYLRFQAQYLRRIRLPVPQDLGPRLVAELQAAFRKRDFASLDRLALWAYGITTLPDFDFVDTRS